MKQLLSGVGLILLLTFVACREEVHTPRPIAYYRIELPDHSYRLFDTLYPYQFEYSKLSYITAVKNPDHEPYWINIVYPSFNANLFVSYKKVSTNIDTLINDSKSFVSAQIQKADDIIEITFTILLNVLLHKLYIQEPMLPSLPILAAPTTNRISSCLSLF
jgi:gliding motility-associated lipoprotein GldD